MSYTNQQIAQLIAQNLAKNKQPIFQKGTTTSTGINREINVSVGGKVVRALGWNVDTPGEVNVFWDAQNKRYIAWKEETRSLKRKVVLAKRKVRPDDKKITILYNFVVAQNGGLLEGFARDKNLSIEDIDVTNYEVIGVTNTGNSFTIILKNQNDYFFIDTDKTQTLLQISPSNFDSGVIPAFYYYGSELLRSTLDYRDDRFTGGYLLNGVFNITATPATYPNSNYYIDDTNFYSSEVSYTTLTVTTGAIDTLFYFEKAIRFTTGNDITIFNSESLYMKGIVLGSSDTGSLGIAVNVNVYEAVGTGEAAQWNLFYTISPPQDYDTSIHYSNSILFNPYHLALHQFLLYNPETPTLPFVPTNWKDIDLVKYAGFQDEGEYTAPVIVAGNISVSPGDTIEAFKARNSSWDSIDGVNVSTASEIVAVNKSQNEDTPNNKTTITISINSNYTATNNITGLYLDEVPSPDVFFWNVALTETINRVKSITRIDSVTIPLKDAKVLPLSDLYIGNVVTSSNMTWAINTDLTIAQSPSTVSFGASFPPTTSGDISMTCTGTYSNTWNECSLSLHEVSIPVYRNRTTTISGSGLKSSSGSVATTKISTKNIKDVEPLFQGIDATLCQKITGQIKRTRIFDIDNPGLTTTTNINTIENTFEALTPIKKSYLLVTATTTTEFSLHNSFFATSNDDGVTIENYHLGHEFVGTQRLKYYQQKTTYDAVNYFPQLFTNNGGSIFDTPVLSESTELPLSTGTLPALPEGQVYVMEYVWGEEEYLDEQEKLIFFEPIGTTTKLHPFNGFSGSATVLYNIMKPDTTTLNKYAGRTLRCFNYLAGDRAFMPSPFISQYGVATRFYPWLLTAVVTNTPYEEKQLNLLQGEDPSLVEIYNISATITTKMNVEMTNIEWTDKDETYIYNPDYEWYIADNKEQKINNFTTSVTTTIDAGFYMWSNVYNDKTIIVSENNHGASIIEYLSSEENRKTANLYKVRDSEGNETVELAVSQIPTQTEKQKEHRADIYRFNISTLKWERRANAVSSLSQLSTIPEYISYHPTPINTERKKRF